MPSGEPRRLVFPVFRSIYGRAGPLRWGPVWSCRRGWLNGFPPVLVALEKAPEPLVAEPMPWVAGEM